MKAFHNKKSVKDKYLARVRHHEIADEIVKGRYWENGKGCAVGCTIHSDNHADYEEKLGIPEWLARLEDTLFEGMPEKDAKKWPAQSLRAIKVGADLEKVKKPFVIYLLQQNLRTLKSIKVDCEPVSDAIKQTMDATKQMIAAQESGVLRRVLRMLRVLRGVLRGPLRF